MVRLAGLPACTSTLLLCDCDQSEPRSTAGFFMYRMYGISREAGEQSLVVGRMSLVKRQKRKREQRTKVQEHFERANARPEGWSTGCAE